MSLCWLFYRRSSKTWAEARLQSWPSTSCPVISCRSIRLTTPGGSKRSLKNTTLPGTASTIGAHELTCLLAHSSLVSNLVQAATVAKVINHVSFFNVKSHIWLVDWQGGWPSCPAGQWTEGPADVSQGAGVLPQMAPGGRDDGQRFGRRLSEGRPVAGLRPREGAEATTGGKYCVCVESMHRC